MPHVNHDTVTASKSVNANAHQNDALRSDTGMEMNFRPGGSTQLQKIVDNSEQVAKIKSLQKVADSSQRVMQLMKIQQMADQRKTQPGMNVHQPVVQKVNNLTYVRRKLKQIAESKGPITSFYEKRQPTAYGYASGKIKHQGPHTVSHVTKRVVMGMLERMEIDPLLLRGTAAVPRPTRVNKLLSDRLSKRGGEWRKKTRGLRTKYLKTYKRHWWDMTSKDKKKALKAFAKASEMHPAGTYNVDKGFNKPGDLSGKGERRGPAAADVLKALQNPESVKKKGFTSIDPGASAEDRKGMARTFGAYGALAIHGKTDEDSGSSESDEDVDLRTPGPGAGSKRGGAGRGGRGGGRRRGRGRGH